MIRILLNSLDVLHSWAVPSIKVKPIACLVKSNKVSLYTKRTGYFYGPCIQIYSVNNTFMPVVVEGIKKEEFFNLFPSRK
jgi:cytochrome c oxidase subunit II